MTKSKRLMELMIAVNKRRSFTARELAEEFQVSTRTIMRDLQVLGELGLPLYAEYGPGGGFRVLNERLLPPIMFSEQEAVAMFFAYQSLQHYGALPFNEEAITALNKFYYYLPDDTKHKIDKMKQRVVFWSPKRSAAVPHLRLLLDASLQMRPLRIVYDSRDGAKPRSIQPIGVYSYKGHWYCPAYCFTRERQLLFRADRVLEAEWATENHPQVDLNDFSIHDWLEPRSEAGEGNSNARLKLMADLTPEGVKRCQWEAWYHESLQVYDIGAGLLTMSIAPDELDYFATFFIGLGADIVIREPAALRERIIAQLRKLSAAYEVLG